MASYYLTCVECGERNQSGGSAASRCVSCGAILPENSANPPSLPPAPSSRADSEIRHDTPVSRMAATITKEKSWAIQIQFRETDQEFLSRLVKNLTKGIQQTAHPSIATVDSIKETKPRLAFNVTSEEKFLPLASLETPIDQDRVRTLILGMQDGLNALHQQGLAVVDFAPEMFFVTSDFNQLAITPSPWMISLIKRAKVSADTCSGIAPEIQTQETAIEVQRIDVYGIGNLAWELLTGEKPDQRNGRLPSEINPSLAHWDEFIDGCSRTNPERRFQTIELAFEKLNQTEYENVSANIPQTNSQQQPTEPASRQHQPAQPHQNKSFAWKNRKPIAVTLFAVVAVTLLLFFLQSAGIGLPASYERGLGHTILRYADRNYQGAKWEKLKTVDALQDSFPSERFRGSQAKSEKLVSVAGWDHHSFLVLSGDSFPHRLFRWKNGKWSVAGKLGKSLYDGFHNLHFPQKSKAILLASRGYDSEQIYTWDGDGLTVSVTEDLDVDWQSGEGRKGKATIFYMTSDRWICYTGRGHALKISGETIEEISLQNKESFVHRRDNTPLDDYPIGNIEFVGSLSTFKGYGIVKESGRRNDWGEYSLVEFENGIWYQKSELKHFSRYPNDVWWHAQNGEADFFVSVGNDTDGDVYVCDINGVCKKLELNNPDFATSMVLIKTWGTSREKFWVMDHNGTVWEYLKGDWRIVVRGLDREKVEFNDAWISPTGEIIAITDDEIYRLK